MDKVFDKWIFARFQKVLSLAFGVCMLSFTLTACSSDETAGGSAEEEGIIAIKDKTVSGVSQKGPFVNGSSVTVQELDGETLSQTGNSFEGKIKNDRGEFSVSVKSLASQYVLLKATGFYRNEVTGEKSSSQVTLYALTDLSERSEVNVNLLTHLEYERSLYLVENDSMSVADAKAKAETEVMNAFKIKGEFKNAEDLNIFGVGDENAALLAISVMMQGNLNEANFSERLADFAQDIEDGEWNDGKMQTEIADWTFDENYAQIRTHINSWNLGDEVPAFEKYLNNFWWQNFGLGECYAENQSEIKQNSNELSAYYEIHFICAENGWRIATDLEKDTYKWEAGNDGDVKIGGVTGMPYVYDKSAWRNASVEESILGGCVETINDSIGVVDAIYYICKNRTWKIAIAIEYDTYHWVAGKDGDVKRGDVVNSNIYVYDEIEGGWRASTTAFDILSIDGCTVKRQLERANDYDEDNETNHYYTCYNKKWYDGNEWTWDLPKEAYLNPEVEYDTIIDARDGKSYKTVKIGDQVWMAENLNYADSNQTPSLKGKSWCYDNNEKYCDIVGRLYAWDAALTICPKGWHLPSYAEWLTLFDTVGGLWTAGATLKTAIGWYSQTGDVFARDTYGFSALPAGGVGYVGNLGLAGDIAFFWSSSLGECDASDPCEVTLHGGENAGLGYGGNAYSVRCLQDN